MPRRLQQETARKKGFFFTQPHDWVKHFFRRQIFNLQCLQGYKEFVVHMASFHGGLDMVMAMDPREEVNVFIKKINLTLFWKTTKVPTYILCLPMAIVQMQMLPTKVRALIKRLLGETNKGPGWWEAVDK